MNSPSYLAEIRREKARADAQRKRDAIRQDVTETILAALLALAVLLAGGFWFWQWISTDNGHAYEANIRWYQESRSLDANTDTVSGANGNAGADTGWRGYFPRRFCDRN